MWNVENINIAIRQIEFYRDSQMFESDEDVLRLYNAWENVIDHIEQQAAGGGINSNTGTPTKKPLAKYNVYFNEVILGDNSMIALLDGTKVAHILHTSY